MILKGIMKTRDFPVHSKAIYKSHIYAYLANAYFYQKEWNNFKIITFKKYKQIQNGS